MVGPGFTKRILGYLRSTLRNSVPFNRMKLMVVGLQVRFFYTLTPTDTTPHTTPHHTPHTTHHTPHTTPLTTHTTHHTPHTTHIAHATLCLNYEISVYFISISV